MQGKDHQEHLLEPSNLTGAFGGIVDAHNGLVRSHSEIQRQLRVIEQDHVQVSKKVQDLGTLQEQHWTSQEQKLESAQLQINEAIKSLTSLIEDKSNIVEKQQKHEINALDAAMSPQLRALERTIEDVVSAQSEMKTRTFPRWSMDINTEVQKIASQLAIDNNHAETRAREIETRISNQESALQSIRPDVTSEMNQLHTRLAIAEETAAKFSSTLATVESRFNDTENKFNQELESQRKKLEEKIVEEAQTVLSSVQSKEGERLTTLENTLKQANFERLNSSEQLGRDVSALRTDMDTYHRDAIDQIKILEQVIPHMEELYKVKNNVNTMQGEHASLAAEVDEVKLRLAVVENHTSSADSKICEQLEHQSRSLELLIKEETGSAMTALANKSAHVTKFEDSFDGVDKELRQELATLRAAMAESNDLANKKIEEFDIKLTECMKPIHTAVYDLSQEMQDFVRFVQNREKDVDQQLVELVNKLESERKNKRVSSPKKSKIYCDNDGRCGLASSAGLSSTASTIPQSDCLRKSQSLTKLRPSSAGTKTSSAGTKRSSAVPPVIEAKLDETTVLRGTGLSATAPAHVGGCNVGKQRPSSSPAAGSAFGAARAARLGS